jgi:hypothetical protein
MSMDPKSFACAKCLPHMQFTLENVVNYCIIEPDTNKLENWVYGNNWVVDPGKRVQSSNEGFPQAAFFCAGYVCIAKKSPKIN